MSRHANIPIFIPHLGCPNQCVFCNQRTISGVTKFSLDKVESNIEQALSTLENDCEVEIAFFGGSFTGIERDLMIALLEIAKKFIVCGRVNSIRCSTRPDYISDEILNILKDYSVKTIELGLQSSSDNVLEISKRGHNFEAEKIACKKIVESGFNLVGQMMIGLPGSDIHTELETARFIIETGAVGARIYPTVVFRDTELCHMCIHGQYNPLDLDEAISRSAAVLELFIDSGISVIRIGLQSSDNLLSDSTYVAGPNHPALGELVEGEYYYNLICKLLSDQNDSDEKIEILCSVGSLSKVIGQRKRNKLRLAERFSNLSFGESEKISGYGLVARFENGDLKCI